MRFGPLLPIGLLLGLSISCSSAPSHPQLPPPRLDPRRELTVAFVIVDGVYNTELTAPLDIFHHTRFHAEPGMRVFTVAPTPDPITSFEGLTITPDHTFDSAPPVDVLVVPSAEHSMDSDLEDTALIEYVRRAGTRAGYVMSLCDGSFVLARAGLLDDLEVTTFPGDRNRMRDMFTNLYVHYDYDFVQDGKAITSVGGALSFDPALHLCELLYGEQAALGIARGMATTWDRTRANGRIVRY